MLLKFGCRCFRRVQIARALDQISLAQCQPNRARAPAPGWKIRQGRFAMESRRRAAMALRQKRAMTSRARSSQTGAIGRKQDASVALGHLERGQEQPFEIVLDLKRLAAVRARECRRIKNDDVELFALARQARQNLQDIVGEEAMIVRRQPIEGKIFASARRAISWKDRCSPSSRRPVAAATENEQV